MGLLVIGFLLALAIALMVYEAYHPRRLRNSMDTTSIDIRRADDGRGDCDHFKIARYALPLMKVATPDPLKLT